MRKILRNTIGSFIAAMMVVTIGCSGMPTVTRTGNVQDVMIRDRLSPADVTVRTGDEVRWINRRQGPVTIIFLDPVADRAACRQGFGGLMGISKGNSATLAPNESASMCFSKAGPVHYTVRMDSALPAGELNVPGSIRVEEGGRSG